MDKERENMTESTEVLGLMITGDYFQFYFA
jgi:hypothetical protein